MNKISFDDLNNKVCVITGGAGVLGTVIAKGLASVGVITAIVDLNKEMADKMAAEIEKESGIKSIGVQANVLDKESLQNAKKEINQKLGYILFLDSFKA